MQPLVKITSKEQLEQRHINRLYDHSKKSFERGDNATYFALHERLLEVLSKAGESPPSYEIGEMEALDEGREEYCKQLYQDYVKHGSVPSYKNRHLIQGQEMAALEVSEYMPYQEEVFTEVPTRQVITSGGESLRESIPELTPVSRKLPTRIGPTGELIYRLFGGRGDVKDSDSLKMGRNDIFAMNGAHYSIARLAGPLSVGYSLLDFSETLVLCRFAPTLINQQSLLERSLYHVFHEINQKGFPELVKHRSELSEELMSKLSKLDPYHGHHNLRDRVNAMPENVQHRILKYIVSPPDVNIRTKVPRFKQQGHGAAYALQHAKEISTTVKEFQKEYYPEFQ